MSMYSGDVYTQDPMSIDDQYGTGYDYADVNYQYGTGYDYGDMNYQYEPGYDYGDTYQQYQQYGQYEQYVLPEKPVIPIKLQKKPVDWAEGEYVGFGVEKFYAFYFVCNDEEVFVGWFNKRLKEMHELEYMYALGEMLPIMDEEIYPRLPSGRPCMLAPPRWNNKSAYVKRPNFRRYPDLRGTGRIPEAFLNEVLAMERVAERPHPNIVEYLGCHLKRGRVSAIVQQRIEYTLAEYCRLIAFRSLDKDDFMEEITSAVLHLHSLGLAHNAVHPASIRIQYGRPVLCEFGTCLPPGTPLDDINLPECFEDDEEDSSVSSKGRDLFALKLLSKWFDCAQERARTTVSPEAPKLSLKDNPDEDD